MAKKQKQNIFIKIYLIVGFLILGYFLIPDDYGERDNNKALTHSEEKVSFSVCTGFVRQEECYVNFPKPILNWNCESGGEKIDNYFFVVQIDDSDNFDYPEFYSEELETSNLFYKINQTGLKFDTNYNWRIKVKNSAGEWSDWAEADEVFKTSLKCK